jgi:glycosyltransferase involved in cell wall biosynthesis
VKGQETFLRAFNAICREMPCYLLFAGRLNEESKRKYLPLVKPEFRNRVIFLGHRDDIPKVLRTIDIFVYPSLLEGLGTALLEAMAAGRPVAVSDIPTFRRFIVEGDNGIFFAPEDPDDLSKKVIRIAGDEALKDRISGKARETVLGKFSLETMIEKTEELYRAVLGL